MKKIFALLAVWITSLVVADEVSYLQLVRLQLPRFGVQSYNSFLMGTKGGWEVYLFGYDQPKPLLEVVKLTSNFKIGDSRLSAGPYVDVLDNRYAGAGVYNFWASSYFRAPLYLSSDKSGHLGFSSPNTQLFTRLNRQWAVGVGSAFAFSEGSTPRILAGPWLEYRPAPNVILRARLGQWLVGPSQGDNQLRLDLVVIP